MLGAHADRLERWLGREQTEQISRAMRGWPGPPIAVANLPGRVWVGGDGDFRGRISGGIFTSLADRAADRARRWARLRGRTLGAGFAGLEALIAGQRAGNVFPFQKLGPSTGAAGFSFSLWAQGNLPLAGTAAAAAAPGGTVHDDSSLGAMPFTNPAGGTNQHFVGGQIQATQDAHCLLLYDRLFSVAKTMNSTATEAVTGVPTRYQSTTLGAADYAGGNFLFPEIVGTLAATAHNWTTCQYTDQDGNTGISLPSYAGFAGGGTGPALDLSANQPWFMALAPGDSGIKALTQMQCDALVASGNINFVIGHPLAWLPTIRANLWSMFDGIKSAFNLARIFDDACLAFLEPHKPGTAACTYRGLLKTALA